MVGMGTRAALVDAAENLFAADGFERASLRAVMRAADADPGSVHYHFGGREALAAAVLERVLAPLNARRLELLADAVAESNTGSTKTSLEALVEAIARPDLEAAHVLDSRGHGRARLIGAIYTNPAAFVTAEVERHFRPVAEQFLPRMTAAVPDVEPETLAWRVRWCLFGMLGTLLLDEDELFATELDGLVDRVVATGAAAIAAREPR